MISLLSLLLAGCAPPSQADLDATRGGRVEAYFNEPGTRDDNIWDPDVIDLMVELIDGADASIDFAVMGFSYDEVVEAFVRAHDRGVRVRMVGDAGHLYNSGYARMDERHIPMVTGNLNHIMHDKFMVVDDRFVFCGTANWTPTDLVRNSNNFVFIDNPAVAADFTAEFEQLFGGAFGHSKVEVDNGRSYSVGQGEDAIEVEVWFSPNEDAMGRILELVDGAQESIRFTIFAFTKDQVGSAFIRKQQEFAELDAAEGVSREGDFREHRSVAGVIDKSQLHSNGQYHEVFRLLGEGIPMRMDGNDASRQPGDYQAGGGRLHSKTMVIDAYGEEPVVITGSFNWSASATVSNDEYLLVLKGARVAELFDDYFEGLWDNGGVMGGDRLGAGVEAGDIIINEVMWYGAHSGDDEGFDEFVELRNLSDRTLDLNLWQLANPDDFVVGFPPGTRVPPGETFVIVDHLMEPYEDGAPQDQNSAYTWGDMVVNAFNDNRQARLYLKDGALELYLKDPDGNILDVAGDGGPAFAGGPSTLEGQPVVRSMERVRSPGDGSDPADWYSYTGTRGSGVVNPDYLLEILASPGERNSPEQP